MTQAFVEERMRRFQTTLSRFHAVRVRQTGLNLFRISL
jgi:hypothetical protein